MRPDTIKALAADFDGATVLVTGGCGFIGSHLVETLVSIGAHVSVLDNLRDSTPANLASVRDRIQIEIGDVRDLSCVKRVIEHCRPDLVFHLAANASVPRSVEEPKYDFETNSMGTFNVLNALQITNLRSKVVLASSGAVYGQPDVFPITEQTLIAPISPYGASKAGAELTSRMFSQVFGAPVVIARIFNTYGPRMARFVILDFLRKLQQNPAVLDVLGDGQQKRDFTFVTDTVQGLLLLAARGEVAEAYNVSSGSSISVTEIAHQLIAALRLTGQTHITYTGTSWPGDAQRWEVSIGKLMQLGYAPAVGLDDGLGRTIQWFQTRT